MNREGVAGCDRNLSGIKVTEDMRSANRPLSIKCIQTMNISQIRVACDDLKVCQTIVRHSDNGLYTVNTFNRVKLFRGSLNIPTTIIMNDRLIIITSDNITIIKWM